jgi:hypothetical protein
LGDPVAEPYDSGLRTEQANNQSNGLTRLFVLDGEGQPFAAALPPPLPFDKGDALFRREHSRNGGALWDPRVRCGEADAVEIAVLPTTQTYNPVSKIGLWVGQLHENEPG